MKENLILVLISAIVTVGIAFYLFNFSSNILGYAIYDINDSADSTNQNIVVTKDMAIIALNKSEKIIEEMIKENFSITFANDTLIEAKKIFEQARYADILRGVVNASAKERLDAVQALKIVNWGDIHYSNVIEYTNKIDERLPIAFSIYDSLNIVEKNINDSRISDKTRQLLEKAKTAFYEDRYDEAKTLIEELKSSIERDKSENSGISGLRKNALNFFQKYGLFVIIGLILFIIMGYYIYKKIEIKILKNKIKKMKAGKIVLSQLIIRNQTERFKENKISGLVYNIRDKKYKDKLQEIEQELPVLEARLRKDSKTKKDKIN